MKPSPTHGCTPDAKYARVICSRCIFLDSIEEWRGWNKKSMATRSYLEWSTDASFPLSTKATWWGLIAKWAKSSLMIRVAQISTNFPLYICLKEYTKFGPAVAHSWLILFFCNTLISLHTEIICDAKYLNKQEKLLAKILDLNLKIPSPPHPLDLGPDFSPAPSHGGTTLRIWVLMIPKPPTHQN